MSPPSPQIVVSFMVVPSVIVPEGRVILINKLHPDAPGISTAKIRKWL
jgi:hypothetical protein